MSAFIGLSRRPSAILPNLKRNVLLLCRNATTNATQVPTTPPQASKEDSGSVTGGKSHSSSVAPAPKVSEVPVAAEIISGAPVELTHRLVRIYQPTRNTMQSGGQKGEKWRIDWDVLPGAGRWQDPLIGWASSADYMQGTRLLFSTKEDAARFAEKQGWDYYIQTPTIKRIPPKNYSENFLYKANTLRLIRTK